MLLSLRLQGDAHQPAGNSLVSASGRGWGRAPSAPDPVVCGTPRPGRDHWALWNLQALLPEATPATLASLRVRRREMARLQHHVLVEGGGDTERLMREARTFIDGNPGLTSGIVATLHMGPYTLTPALLLMAGERPAVLLDAEAYAAVRPRAEEQRRRLGLQGDIEWIVVDRPLFVKDLLRALRDGRPVVIYLDGNRGLGGTEATRDHGLPYSLPGRTIRLRNGLGRLIGRLGCPVHGVVARWRDDGTLDWELEELGPWNAGTPAAAVTRALYDWLFAQVIRSPEQWTYWGMLAASSDCFATQNLQVDDAREHARRNAAFLEALVQRPEAVRFVLTSRIEIWDPGVLADRDRDAFYDAEGLTDAALDLLRGRRPTLAELNDDCGRRWVGFHARRLFLLGLAELRVDE